MDRYPQPSPSTLGGSRSHGGTPIVAGGYFFSGTFPIQKKWMMMIWGSPSDETGATTIWGGSQLLRKTSRKLIGPKRKPPAFLRDDHDDFTMKIMDFVWLNQCRKQAMTGKGEKKSQKNVTGGWSILASATLLKSS